MRISAVGFAIFLCLYAPATAEMYTIKNPAEKINNPAGTMYNPATQVNNPAARIDNPSPLSTPTRPVPPTKATVVTPEPDTAKLIKEKPQLQPRPAIPEKWYNLKTAGAYIALANKAFVRDDYREFLAITEDALRRISAGTLKASNKMKQKLLKYGIIGYELLIDSEG
jgi:hypothetical protein